MKEILFRGKRVDNGKEVIGFYFNVPEHHNPDLSGKSIIISINNGLYFEVVPETVGQYTGLRDKKGKRIFEGDICKTCFESYTRNWEEVGVVVTEFCGAYGIKSADGKHFRAFINETVYARSCEVIGNIYDNPELLESKE